MTNRRKRREFTKAIRIAAWDRSGGFCEKCECKLYPGKFIYDHDIPWVISEDSSLENCVVQCSNCDKPKTAIDQGVIAKTRRIEEKHLNIGKAKKPWNTRFKKKMDGTVIDRETGKPV